MVESESETSSSPIYRSRRSNASLLLKMLKSMNNPLHLRERGRSNSDSWTIPRFTQATETINTYTVCYVVQVVHVTCDSTILTSRTFFFASKTLCAPPLLAPPLPPCNPPPPPLSPLPTSPTGENDERYGLRGEAGDAPSSPDTRLPLGRGDCTSSG